MLIVTKWVIATPHSSLQSHLGTSSYLLQIADLNGPLMYLTSYNCYNLQNTGNLLIQLWQVRILMFPIFKFVQIVKQFANDKLFQFQTLQQLVKGKLC